MIVMIMMIAQEDPFLMAKTFDNERLPDKVKDRYEGYCRDLAELITNKLNISCNYSQLKLFTLNLTLTKFKLESSLPTCQGTSD